MLRFQNDYSEGAHPNVLRALCDTNLCSTPGYGLDDDRRRAADAIRARFACPDADVHFLVGGTQTNQLAAAAFLRPWEAMVAADTGHINVHETGAIEATGHKVIAVPGADGKLTPPPSPTPPRSTALPPACMTSTWYCRAWCTCPTRRNSALSIPGRN